MRWVTYGLAASLMVLAGCGNGEPAGERVRAPAGDAVAGAAADGPAGAGPSVGDGADTVSADVAATGPDRASEPLAWAIAGSWRSETERARDTARHPAETLAFFGIEPDDTVIELWPGGGWYSSILAPYLATGGGTLIAAGFDPDVFEGERRARIVERLDAYADRFTARPDLFGTVRMTAFSDRSGPLTTPGSADVVLTFRNLHNWMAGGYADKAFSDAFTALKPGGILGVVEHRLPSSANQDPVAMTGYVHEDYVRRAAERAGFVFVESTEVNANPKDTADHPFGVWTLPPNSRTEDRNGEAPDGFDPALYAAIGESDRMTLKFVKPLADGTVPGTGPDAAGSPEEAGAPDEASASEAAGTTVEAGGPTER